MENQQDPQLPPEFSQLASLVETRPEAFIAGDTVVQSTALAAAKLLFDTCELE
jgi:hypothetical protein